MAQLKSIHYGNGYKPARPRLQVVSTPKPVSRIKRRRAIGRAPVGQVHPPGFDQIAVGLFVFPICLAVVDAYQVYMQRLYTEAMAQTLAVLIP